MYQRPIEDEVITQQQYNLNRDAAAEQGERLHRDLNDDILRLRLFQTTTVTTVNPNFIKDEICKVYFTGATAQGQVLSFSNTSLHLQHVSGEYVYSNSGYIVGTESGSNVTFNTASLVIKNIPDEELIYWSPVTYYEYEMKKNEYNKTLRVIDKVYTQKLSDNLKTTMNE
jgi:hypothetical protein